MAEQVQVIVRIRPLNEKEKKQSTLPVVSASSTKNEAVGELVDDDTALPEDEMVSEIRFTIPMREDDDAAEKSHRILCLLTLKSMFHSGGL